MARRGFTLIELAVTLGIVALMTALLLPVAGDRLKSAGASQMAVQLQNVHTAAKAFYLDVGRWPGELSQLADAPGTGAADTADLFGGTIPPSDARAWAGPYLNVATLPDDGLDLAGSGELASPFAVTRWAGDEFFTIPVRGVSREDAERVSDLFDGHTRLEPGAPDAGRVRWERDTLFFLAEPIRR